MSSAGIGHPHKFKMGRKPRIFNPSIPHMSSILGAVALPPIPSSCDYLSALPADMGMMLNDQLGDCTCAAVYHAIQLWTFHCAGNGGTMQTNSDESVKSIYEQWCGYRDGDPSTDQGGIEQHVLHEWFSKGCPIDAAGGGPISNKLSAWFEVDPRNQNDVKRVINDCGLCYIGFEVPENILPPNGDPPKRWTVDPHAQIVGGHAVILGSYDPVSFGVVSWGEHDYVMDQEFFSQYVDEAYALVDMDWINATGKTPLGLDIGQLTHMMRLLRAA